MNDEDARTVDAVQTSIDIVELLQAEGWAGVTELAAALDRSKSSVHAHLSTLFANELVVRDDGEYALSLQLLDLAETAKSRLGYYDVMTSEVDDLAAATGELAQFATEEHGRAVYLYKSEGEQAVQTASTVGKREFLHCIALGKAMLAHMSEARVEAILDRHGLPTYTEATVRSRDELHETLDAVRERGYAFDREEKIEGLRCVAAPVLNNDELLGAVSVSGPTSRMRDERFQSELPETVTRTANVIEINARFT